MDRSEISHILKLHNLAYDLLMWLDKRASSDPYVLSPEQVEIIKSGKKCALWLNANRNSVPPELLPTEQDIPIFANLLSSFFHTSFHVQYFEFNNKIVDARLVADADQEAKQRRGGRQPGMTSKQILTLALKHLASSEGIKINETEAQKIAKHSGIEKDIIIWAYVWELGRRARKASKGPALHTIWRRIDLGIRKNLNSDLVWSSRTKILEHLNQHGFASS